MAFSLLFFILCFFYLLSRNKALQAHVHMHGCRQATKQLHSLHMDKRLMSSSFFIIIVISFLYLRKEPASTSNCHGTGKHGLPAVNCIDGIVAWSFCCRSCVRNVFLLLVPVYVETFFSVFPSTRNRPPFIVLSFLLSSSFTLSRIIRAALADLLFRCARFYSFHNQSAIFQTIFLGEKRKQGKKNARFFGRFLLAARLLRAQAATLSAVFI